MNGRTKISALVAVVAFLAVGLPASADDTVMLDSDILRAQRPLWDL